LARKISGEFDMQQRTPVIKQLLYTIPKGNDPDAKDASDILAPFDYSLSNDVLNYYGARYVTISKLYTDQDVFDLAQKFVETHIAYSNKYEDKYLVAYQVKTKIPSGFYVQLNDSDNNQYSSSFIAGDGLRYREMGSGSGLRIVNMGSSEQKVKITVNAKGATGLIFSSTASTQTDNKLNLGDLAKEYVFNAALKPGENVISFSVLAANGKPVSISDSKKKPAGALVSRIAVEAE